MNPDIMSEVIAAIRQVVRRDEVVVGPETTIDELGIESLDMVELMFLLEDKFGVEMPYNANEVDEHKAAATVGSVVATLDAMVRAKHLPAAA